MRYAFLSTVWHRTSIEQTIMKGKLEKMYINTAASYLIILTHNSFYDYLIASLNNTIYCCDMQVQHRL